MNKILLLVFVLALARFDSAAQGYNFSNSTGSYTDLTGATVLSAPGWDDDDYTIPIGFPFHFNSAAYTSLSIESNGLIYLDANLPHVIVAYDADFIDMGNASRPSVISYNVSGAAGSRILKIEWKNARFFNGTPNDYANFQVWLYEGAGNKIEIRFGPMAIANNNTVFGPTGGTDHGLAFAVDEINETFSALLLTGNPNSPTAVTFNNAPVTALVFLSGPPPNGTIYTFSQGSVGIKEYLNNPGVSIYPNPATDMLYIKGLEAGNKGSVIRVFDVLGRLAYETASANNSAVIPVNIAGLKPGTYYIELVSGEQRVAKHFIKK